MKILFITCSRIGDAVLTTGLLKEIQNRYPFASVTVAVDPLPAALFEDYPLLDNLIIFSKKRHSKHWFDLWKKVKGQKWDWIIDMRGSLISYTLWAKKRIVWKSKPKDTRHKVEQVSALLGAKILAPGLWFTEERFYKAKKFFQDEVYIAVAPAANWVGKQWPITSFIELFKRFIREYPGVKIAIFAAPYEKNIVDPLIQSLPKENVMSFLDQNLSLIETAACINQCKMFIGNDSGLMHVAAAVGIPTIGLFGPSKEQNYRPWQNYDEARNTVVRTPMTYDQMSSRPGFSHKSQDCYMGSLDVETVWQALISCIQRTCKKE